MGQIEQEVAQHAPIIILLLAILILTMCAVGMVYIIFQALTTQKRAGASPWCGHCGVSLKSEPISGIDTESYTLLVYECRICGNKTYLPTPGHG